MVRILEVPKKGGDDFERFVGKIYDDCHEHQLDIVAAEEVWRLGLDAYDKKYFNDGGEK